MTDMDHPLGLAIGNALEVADVPNQLADNNLAGSWSLIEDTTGNSSGWTNTTIEWGQQTGDRVEWGQQAGIT